MKPGYKTTEFWLSLVTVLVTAVAPLLVYYGVVTNEEAEIWQTAIIAVVGALAAGLASAAYSYSRARVKTNS